MQNTQVAAAIRKQKVDMFSERTNTTEALEYTLSGIPEQLRPFVTTGIMVYHNTLLEVVSKALEKYDARPNSNESR